MLSLGIIGAGRLGSFHADKAAQNPNVALKAVFDASSASRENLAAKHGIVAYDSCEELLTQVNAVVIATPSVTHFQLGIECLRRGIHVLMEKPLTTTHAEAQKLVALAQKNNCVLQVGHVEEFNPAWTAAAPVLDTIRRGARTFIHAVRTSPYTFRSTDIGATLDMMIHDLDLVLSLIPAPLRRVEATAMHVIGSSEHGGHEDIVEARLIFANRSVATLQTSRVEAAAQRVMTLKTATDSASIDFGTRRVTLRRASNKITRGDFAPLHLSLPENTSPSPAMLEEEFVTTVIEPPAVDALALEMEDFVTACATKKSPRVSGARAALSVQVAEEIIAAAQVSCNASCGRILPLVA